MSKHLRGTRRNGEKPLLRPLASLAAIVLTAACGSVLDVEAPGLIPADDLNDPSKAGLLVNGVIADFDCAYGAYVVLTGIMTDELEDATQTASRWPYDQRDVRPDDSRYATFGCEALGVYTPLSTARFTAENALQLLQGWTDAQVTDRTSLIATSALYSAYAHLLLGEGFCSGVLLDGELEPGGEVQPADLFRKAEERFTLAISAAQAAGNTEILNAAYVGRARARLNLEDGAGAVADATQVPKDFVFNSTAADAPSRRENRVYDQNNPADGLVTTVAPAFRDLTFGGVADPRVRVLDTGQKSTTGLEIFAQTKYTTASAPIPLATGNEAQLIIAEVQGGETAVGIINELHAEAGLPAFSSSDPAEIQRQVSEERARELFLQGHRLYDVRRLGLELTPAPGTPYRNGGVYGTDTCLPLPDVERLNNPNIG